MPQPDCSPPFHSHSTAEDAALTDRSLSRRRFLAGLGAGAVALGLVACSEGPTASPAAAATPTPEPIETPEPEPSHDAALRTRIAGLLIVGFRGFTVGADDALAREIRDLGLGGVILFEKDGPTGGLRNIDSPGQVRKLCADLQAIAADSPIGGPLIIAADQEGGNVARLDERHGFPATMSAAALAAKKDPAKTQKAAGAMAATLATAGINLNLAPVVDLNINPKSPAIGALGRSFSPKPATVIEQAEAFIRGNRDHEIATALKHFPGHGSARTDTHLGLTDVTKTWTEKELEPFARLVTDGYAEAILVAHVFNATLDPDHPASLSQPIITGILREKLGFGGPVITDDLEMGAITDSYGFDEALALALEAGADLLLLANQVTAEENLATRAVDAIESAVSSGRLSADQIDAAWQRVNAFRLGLLPGPA